MDNLTFRSQPDLERLDTREHIIVKGARVNNLKDLSVAIPRNQFVVITGLSGSGKSSLAFDTLFAEGQRVYIESLSAYARQFLGKIEKPAVDYIKGISPAISIKQGTIRNNPRSTVGTTTEIYDYLKLLYARVGVTHSPISGQPVIRHGVSEVVDYIQQQPVNSQVAILSPLRLSPDRNLSEILKIELEKGFTRVFQHGNPLFIEELIADPAKLTTQEKLFLLIDRLRVKEHDHKNQARIADSLQIAFSEGDGVCAIEIIGRDRKVFSNRLEEDGVKFETPSVSFFSFNDPRGACQTCEGFGHILGIDRDKVIPNKQLSIEEGAILPWQSANMQHWQSRLISQSAEFDFPIQIPYEKLSVPQRELLWKGNQFFDGLNAFFEHLAIRRHKIQYRVLLARYRGKTKCPDCRGSRIRKDASYVKVGNTSIVELLLMPVKQLVPFFNQLVLEAHQQLVADRILREIKDRLSYLEKVGLGYLTLNRQMTTLSGGEYQRTKLATSLGSALVGTMYILDEPTVGLHPRDTHRLKDILITLKQLDNTVIVVEHEETIMRAADQLIDIGPEAGQRGGKIVFQGDWNALKKCKNGHTARYLNGIETIPIPTQRREWQDAVIIQGAQEHNLKNIDVKIPLKVFTAITGVSGSGKSTLIREIVYPAISEVLGNHQTKPGRFSQLTGDLQKIFRIEFIDQQPIGRSSRSSPITYVKAYDAIRQIFATQPLAQQRGYKPSHFSFNVEGGRCEVCKGEGDQKIEMQFMADIWLTCEECEGKRFKEEINEVKYNEKSIHEVLNMTVEEGLDFFQGQSEVLNKLKVLQTVGLGYVGLGQSSSSLSGGEAQRVKLAFHLSSREQHEHTLFIFDEPTTGLHTHDIRQLLKAINALIDQGHSVIVIEHNVEVIKCADWVIDLGPEGGEQGGEVTYSGTPEGMIALTDNHTAQYLREKFQ